MLLSVGLGTGLSLTGLAAKTLWTKGTKLSASAFHKRVIEHLTRDSTGIKDGRYNVMSGPIGFIHNKNSASGAEVVEAAAKHFATDREELADT
jgi:hypothetical protein